MQPELRVMVGGIGVSIVLAIASNGAPGGFSGDLDPQAITNGSSVEVCGWPTTVYTGGCTGTLVHPKAISTAQHCGTPSAIQFGEAAGAGPSVPVLGCVGDGSQDAMLCELAEEVTEVPVTPVLLGCEVDAYLQVGQPVVMAGFGQTSYGVGGGTKLWADQEIAAVEPGRVIIGQAGDGVSPCPGDSGGPVFVQTDDGSWRVIGTVLGGTTGTPCNSAADFQRIDAVVANFEAQRGLDITPCFDAATGAWEAGPDCGDFFAGDHTGAGTWGDWCTGTPASGYSDQCGEPFADNGDDDDDDDAGTGDAGETGDDDDDDDDGLDDGDGADGPGDDDDAEDDDAADDDDGDDDDDEGDTDGAASGPGFAEPLDYDEGCVTGRRRPAPLAFAMVLVLLAAARRRE